MLTIAFTDIEGSTEIMERLGEDRFVEVMIVHNRMVRDCVGSHGGEVVKSQGDGFMIIFSSASAALDCAVELQRILTRYHVREPAEALLVRVGLHTGNIFQAEYDFLGRAIVLAARITGRRARRRDTRVRRLQGLHEAPWAMDVRRSDGAAPQGVGEHGARVSPRLVGPLGTQSVLSVIPKRDV